MNQTMVMMPIHEYENLKDWKKKIMACIQVEDDEDAGEIHVVSLQKLFEVLETELMQHRILRYGDPVILFDDLGVSLLDDDARFEYVRAGVL